MSVDYESLFDDYGIQYWTEGKNVTQGWVNVCCPHKDCDDMSNHGGFSPDTGHYNCWKCGWHPSQEIIALLLDVSIRKAKEIILNYTTSDTVAESKANTARLSSTKAKILVLPSSFKRPGKIHREYLSSRGFDPDRVIDRFRLLGSSHIGSYKFRIIAPIFFEGKLVSYQGRDITNLSELRYKACRIEDELIHHKDIFYNFDTVTECGVLVEGITDVWRLGFGSFASFGTGVTHAQTKLLKRKAKDGTFKKMYILLDKGRSENKKAEMLASEMLMIKNFEVLIIYNHRSGDPADLNQKNANALMRDIGLRGWNE